MTNGLLKPELAIHRWGPIINDMDVSEEDDETSTYPEKNFLLLFMLIRGTVLHFTTNQRKNIQSLYLKKVRYTILVTWVDVLLCANVHLVQIPKKP